jgi:enolase
MTKITDVHATEILDSRGNPTVQVTLSNESADATAKVPSGASTGRYEAHELRDNDADRYRGKGVQRAITNVNTTIRQHIVETNPSSQAVFDQTLNELDGTNTKSELGANAILGCSMAYARLTAKTNGEPLHATLGDNNRLPTPYANIINGGDHAGNDLALQEFMITPITAATPVEATRIIAETYHELHDHIAATYGAQHTGVGDEGGFAPPVSDPEEAIELITTAAKQVGHADSVGLAVDAAANEFHDESTDTYHVDGKSLSTDELTEYYTDLINDHPIISLEDPFHDDDFEAFASLLDAVHGQARIVGDDLTVSNPERVETAVELQSADELLLKVNQIGSVTEAKRAASIAHSAGWDVMVSHRSGETSDPFIIDLAIGIGAKHVKIGAPCRGERTAKYNRLLELAHPD